eukprot:CAMPEP_0203831168 /NCGR_PEP_ID=MMETSP0115-20131106/67666_1 /ASSEMBLY_ACC=CAM_ASM_000227 /TAXON_ID=33651 /ORGANISM="Bicosoecid sp, Strain ms1" /LENGTH=74 /DNA_ID=CAMNT_0050740233 /DNA_START=18 /DNA_END=242 /DNA_ORIENTATION=-
MRHRSSSPPAASAGAASIVAPSSCMGSPFGFAAPSLANLKRYPPFTTQYRSFHLGGRQVQMLLIGYPFFCSHPA